MNLIRSFCAGALLFIPAPLLALKIINAADEPISITFQQDGDERRARVIRPGASITIETESVKPGKFTVTTLDTHIEGDYIVNSSDKLKIKVKDHELLIKGITAEQERKERKQ